LGQEYILLTGLALLYFLTLLIHLSSIDDYWRGNNCSEKVHIHHTISHVREETYLAFMDHKKTLEQEVGKKSVLKTKCHQKKFTSKQKDKISEE